jgi:hypothetical protein
MGRFCFNRVPQWQDIATLCANICTYERAVDAKIGQSGDTVQSTQASSSF